MDEAGAYDAIRPRLQSLGLDPQRVESVLASGVPDVWYTAGAIEMKYLAEWPKRDSTPVRVQTLIDRPEQVAWLMRRWISGGPAWLMLRVDSQYLLFAGPHARLVRYGLTKYDIIALSCWKTGPRGLADWEELKAWLTWDEAALPPEKRERLHRLRTLDMKELHKASGPVII